MKQEDIVTKVRRSGDTITASAGKEGYLEDVVTADLDETTLEPRWYIGIKADTDVWNHLTRYNSEDTVEFRNKLRELAKSIVALY